MLVSTLGVRPFRALGRTRFVIRGSSYPVAELLQNPPPDIDSLAVVELVMEIEEKNGS